MKQIIFVVLLAFSALAVHAQQIRKVKMPELLALIDSSEGPLVVNFWATWCGPCVQEIPWFEKQVASFDGKGVKLILVSLDFADEYPARLQAFVNKKQYGSQVVWLDETDADYFCPMIDKKWEGGIPATLFVNKPSGYRKFRPVQLKEKELAEELKKLVE